MKFAIGVRVEGKSGQFQRVQGIISNRLKVGSQNLLEIQWSDGRVSRVSTGAVTVLGARGPNDGVVQVNEDIGGLQAEDIDGNESEDDLSQRSDSSEEGSERDLGDQDGLV
jgi:hypothetical protein